MNLTTFKTLVIREYWENRSLKFAPAIIGGVFIFTFLVALVTGQALFSTQEFGDGVRLGFANLSNSNMDDLPKALMVILFGPFLIGLLFVMFFYTLGSLYNDRKDRSILFWKSMPVSDLQTVLSKVFTAFVVAPVLTAIVAVITQIAGLVIFTLSVWFNGGSAWDIVWSNSSLLQVIFNDFAVAITFGLWMAPILGWLWFVSAIAKRVAFLIALFVPLGIMLVEGMIFHTAYFGRLIGEHFAQMEYIVEGTFESGHPFMLFQQAGFWIGIVVCAGFVACATYIRRFRDDSY